MSGVGRTFLLLLHAWDRCSLVPSRVRRSEACWSCRGGTPTPGLEARQTMTVADEPWEVVHGAIR